jgi:hypothetical protein
MRDRSALPYKQIIGSPFPKSEDPSFWPSHLKKTFGSMAILKKLFSLLTVLMRSLSN